MSDKHTPGTWGIEKLERTSHPHAQERGMIEPCSVFSYYENRYMDVAIIDGEADARLISAAPDLLEACREMLEEMEECGHERGRNPVMTKARAAIKKATGE